MKLFSHTKIHGDRKADRIFNKELRAVLSCWVPAKDMDSAMKKIDRVMQIGAELGVGTSRREYTPVVWLKCPKCPASAGGMAFSRDVVASALLMEYKCGKHDVLLEIVDKP